MNDDVKVVFDVDGVLSSFEFGELKHSRCKDEEWNNRRLELKKFHNRLIFLIQKI